MVVAGDGASRILAGHLDREHLGLGDFLVLIVGEVEGSSQRHNLLLSALLNGQGLAVIRHLNQIDLIGGPGNSDGVVFGVTFSSVLRNRDVVGDIGQSTIVAP